MKTPKVCLYRLVNIECNYFLNTSQAEFQSYFPLWSSLKSNSKLNVAVVTKNGSRGHSAFYMRDVLNTPVVSWHQDWDWQTLNRTEACQHEFKLNPNTCLLAIYIYLICSDFSFAFNHVQRLAHGMLCSHLPLSDLTKAFFCQPDMDIYVDLR